MQAQAAPAMMADTRQPTVRRLAFTPVRWTAIFAGLAAGLGSYLLLALLGIAVGLTSIEPQAAEPLGAVPAGTAIWSGISMLIAAFIGGYTAARLSGLARKSDGLFHGLVVWGATTLLFAWLATTAISGLLGGTISVIGQTLQTAGQGAAAAVSAVAGPQQGGQGQQQGGFLQRLETMLTGSPRDANLTPQVLDRLQTQIAQGNPQAAQQILVNELGFSQERAATLTNQAMALFGQQGGQQQQVQGPGAEPGGVPPQVEQAAAQTTSALTSASWWLFAALLLSLLCSLGGGILGVRPTGNRTKGEYAHHDRTSTPLAEVR